MEKEEAEEAIAFLESPENAGDLDVRFEDATRGFVDNHFGMAVFPEVSCSFYLLENPRNG